MKEVKELDFKHKKEYPEDIGKACHLIQKNSMHVLSLGFMVKILFIFRELYFVKFFSLTTCAVFHWNTYLCLLGSKDKI